MTTTNRPTDRKALHAYVSDDAHDYWHGFATEHGVTVSAVLEALAPVLGNCSPKDPAKLTDVLNEVVKAARKIDAARRRRIRS